MNCQLVIYGVSLVLISLHIKKIQLMTVYHEASITRLIKFVVCKKLKNPVNVQ